MDETARSNRARDGHVTRERILEEAQAVFSRSGYSGANLSEIAQRVGIRKASLYYHFRTKGDLYAEVLRTILRDLQGLVLDAMHQPGPPAEQVDHLVDAFIDLIARKRHYAILAFREIVDRNLDIDAMLREHIHPMLRLVVEQVEDGQRGGVFKAFDPVFLLIGSVGMVLFYFAASPVVLAGYAPGDPVGGERIEAIKNEVKRMVRDTLLV